MHNYIDGVHEGNKGKKDPTPVDKEEIKLIREEAWWRLVKMKIRRVFIPPDGKGKWIITKPITGDPFVDHNNDHPNASQVFIPNT